MKFSDKQVDRIALAMIDTIVEFDIVLTLKPDSDTLASKAGVISSLFMTSKVAGVRDAVFSRIKKKMPIMYMRIVLMAISLDKNYEDDLNSEMINEVGPISNQTVDIISKMSKPAK